MKAQNRLLSALPGIKTYTKVECFCWAWYYHCFLKHTSCTKQDTSVVFVRFSFIKNHRKNEIVVGKYTDDMQKNVKILFHWDETQELYYTKGDECRVLSRTTVWSE